MAKTEVTSIAIQNKSDQNRKPPKMRMVESEKNVVILEIHGDIARLNQVTDNLSVTTGLVNQIAKLGTQDRNIDEEASNFALGFVDAMEPRDAAEALLLTQMAAIHQTTMMMAQRMNRVENIPQQDAAERALNKLGRTYSTQMDALKRYRSKGQIVRVERVTVEPGAQAVIGNVNHGGRDDCDT